MPLSASPLNDLSAAKHNFVAAAGDVDPLRAVRERPFLLVGTAALIGAVLGSSRGTIGGSVKLVSGALGFLRPIATSFTRVLLSRMAHHHAHEAMKDAEKAQEHAST